MNEQDSVWTHKPWWCQPWSILLTGVVLMDGSWVLMRMVFFLLVYPRLMLQSGLSDAAPPPQQHK